MYNFRVLTFFWFCYCSLRASKAVNTLFASQVHTVFVSLQGTAVDPNCGPTLQSNWRACISASLLLVCIIVSQIAGPDFDTTCVRVDVMYQYSWCLLIAGCYISVVLAAQTWAVHGCLCFSGYTSYVNQQLILGKMVSELWKVLDGERTGLLNLNVLYRHFPLVTKPRVPRLRNVSP
jgi:hypothetical protein